ncbi:MAG TPA: zf-HC2 domain-containing protein [Solirubrobacteraceae bacterium]|nr:zf-HC2 domain-containing protein [Solirubrobacteraceae bacterium]
MPEYSRGGFSGRFREWRSRRAEARGAARWPTPPEPAPEAPVADDPLATRWVPDSEREAAAPPPAPAPTPTLSESSRWLIGDSDPLTEATASPAGTTAVLTAPSDWLPGNEQAEPLPAEDRGDPSRWLPAPDAAANAPTETIDQRRAAAVAYCLVLCESAAVAAAVDEAIDEADDSAPGLLLATRTAAAEHAVPVSTPTTWRERLAAEHEHPCSATYHRLAERANGTLGSREERALQEHLETCAQCRDAEEHERQATAAFVAVLPAATGAVAPAPVPAARPRRRRLAPIALLAGAAGLIAVIAVAVVLLTDSDSTHHAPAASRQAVTPTQSSPPKSAAKHATAVRTARHHKPTPARHKATSHHKTAAHKVTHPAATRTVVVPVTRTAQPTTVAPVVTPPTYTPPAASQPSGTKVSGISQPSLPSESAPTQGVGTSK